MTYDRVSPEIAAKQAQYAARKWSALIYCNSYSGTHRFVFFREAVEYVREQRKVSAKYDPRGLTPFYFELAGPGGKFAPQDVQEIAA